MDWGILAVGVLTFLFSFVAFYTGSYTVAGVGTHTSSASAWNDVIGGGFFAWFAMVFAVAGAAILALQLFAAQVKIPIPVSPRLLVLYAFTAAAVFEILAIVIHPKFASGKAAGFKYSVGHGFGFWISLILVIAGAVLAYLTAKSAGEKMPWEKGGGGNTPPQQQPWQGGGYPQQ